MKPILSLLLIPALVLFGPAFSPARSSAADQLTEDNTKDLHLRNIGPAITPGRVTDIAVDPNHPSVWYVSYASSGLWKTSNRGTTWQPVFDQGGSYSLGCVTVDPKDSDVVWLGTGENASQRSVGFGDGVYKSTDAGKTWKRAGLPKSEHIGKILIDPRDSKVVWVASEGPLWAPGGDRGLYKTTDGGDTWKAVLQISENTGVNDIALDPRNPDVIYATAFQRRRHTGILIGGGPEGAIYKSTDGGANWTKLTNGIPTVDLGRIAIAISPQKPDVVYALVTAANRESGFFRSEDSGATWTRQSSFSPSVPEYYIELFVNPHKFDSLFTVDVNMRRTDDGGKNFPNLTWRGVHSDHHALYLDPADENHMLNGNDDGVYETWDNGVTWRHFNNMPTTQYYRVGIDNALPFYNLYGGAQDNGTYGGPSRSINRVGVRTADWERVGGADGFQPRVDPEEPNIVYSMSQQGGMVRLDRLTDARKTITKPRGAGTGTNAVRWNWDAPFIISSHFHDRIYLAGSELFRSDDRGDSWTRISGDLTKHIDTDTIPVMGKHWGADAVDKNRSTTPFGVASALAESPLNENLLFVGTDDGQLQITEDGGKNWRKIDKFPGVPELAYLSCVHPSALDPNTLYVTFNNYQYGDYKPYVLKSTNLGRNWTSITGDLPVRQFPWAITGDPVNPDLLFVGTEFGLYFSVNGGKHWIQIKNGVPPIPFRDLQIQHRENDLVAATFGRGFYILDDYSALRGLTPEILAGEGSALPLRKAYTYNELTQMEVIPQDYTATNPPFGAMMSYYLRADLPSGTTTVLTIADASGKEIIKLNGQAKAGLHRVNWNLRGTTTAGTNVITNPTPVAQRGGGAGGTDDNLDEPPPDRGNADASRGGAGDPPAGTNQPAGRGAGRGGRGGGRTGGGGGGAGGGGRGGRGGNLAPFVKPGLYTVTLNKQTGTTLTPLGRPQTFEVAPLPAAPIRKAAQADQQ